MEKVTDPAELCGMRLKNHLVRSATWFGLCRPDGTLLPEMYERYETLAAGGVGMIITELTDVSEWNNAIGDNMRLYSDRLIPDYQKLVSIAHRYGAVILPELNMYLYVSSAAPHRVIEVNSLSIDDIADIRRLFVDAAVRSYRCGFDGVQLHLAYGWLLYRFLSPWFNRRRDAYGGSVENRARIVTEIIHGIKERLPGDPVSAKFSFYVNRSLTDYDTENCVAICDFLYQNGLDFIEVLGDHSGLEHGNHHPSCYQDLAIAVRQQSDIPLILTGCNSDPGVMNALLNDHGIPFFGISRGLIREPDLPNRWAAGDAAPGHCIHCDGCYQTLAHHCRFVY